MNGLVLFIIAKYMSMYWIFHAYMQIKCIPSNVSSLEGPPTQENVQRCVLLIFEKYLSFKTLFKQTMHKKCLFSIPLNLKSFYNIYMDCSIFNTNNLLR